MVKNEDMIFGLRPVIEAIEAGKEVNRLLIQKGLQGDLFAEVKALTKQHEIQYQVVPIEKLNRITRKNHQGIICFLSPVTYHNIEDVIPQIYEAGETPLILVLDRVTDVRNFGAIARTAECSGAHGIVIPTRGSVQITGDAVKTSAGALHRIPVCREENLKKTLDFLQMSGLQLVACTEKTEHTLYEVDYRGPTAIIMGSEEDGISGEYLKRADFKASIPMSGEIGSLNVSVATGVILYEAIRQRTNPWKHVFG